MFTIQHEKIDYVFVDEIQKIPELLDEIHQLIEETKISFILSGSSARKIKRTHANMLGGRAMIVELFGLTSCELGEHFALNRVLQLGSLTGLYFEKNSQTKRKLLAYVNSYLKDEIAGEGLVRNLGAFQRFLEVAANYFGEILNIENIARESSTSAKTIAGYFTILEDSLIGFKLPAWEVSIRKQLAKHSKFYLFDNGVSLAIMNAFSSAEIPIMRGRLFEQWLLNEVRAHLSYNLLELKMYYWRTQAGNEVDLILSNNQIPIAAIEIKAMKQVVKKNLSGLLSFIEEYPKVKFKFLVCEVEKPYEEIEGILVLPWNYFLEKMLPIIFPSSVT